MMTVIPMAHGLILAGILFALGLTGLLMRRNLVFILMSHRDHAEWRGRGFCCGGLALGPARRPDHVSLHPGHGGGGSLGRLWRWCFSSIIAPYTLDADAASEMRG